jgi:hypothetical protein
MSEAKLTSIRSDVVLSTRLSAEEFLTSARLYEEIDIVLRRYHVTPAHTLAAQAFLGTLLHLDKDFVNRNSLGHFTLAKYAEH